MVTHNIAVLLSPDSNPRKKLGVGDAIKVAQKGDVIQQPIPLPKYITAHYRILAGDNALQRTQLDWFDHTKNRIKVNAPLRTNENGWGMLCIEESDYRDLSSLHLVVKQGKRSITFPEFACSEIRKKVTIQGPEKYILEFADPSEPMLEILPVKKGRRRFTVAVSGTQKQLKKAIPLLENRACIRIETAFIEGKIPRNPLAGKEIKYALLDSDMPGKLDKIDCLIDLSGNPVVSKLAKEQQAGAGSTRTIVIPDAARFLGREEKILSHYKGPVRDSKDFTELLAQVSKMYFERGF